MQARERSAMEILAAISDNPKLTKALKDRANAILQSKTESLLKKIEDDEKRAIEGARMHALAAEEYTNKAKEKQQRCSHVKRNPVTNAKESHLRGQQHSDGLIFLFCQSCGKAFSDPPRPEENWDPIPGHLMPARTEI